MCLLGICLVSTPEGVIVTRTSELEFPDTHICEIQLWHAASCVWMEALHISCDFCKYCSRWQSTHTHIQHRHRLHETTRPTLHCIHTWRERCRVWETMVQRRMFERKANVKLHVLEQTQMCCFSNFTQTNKIKAKWWIFTILLFQWFSVWRSWFISTCHLPNTGKKDGKIWVRFGWENVSMQKYGNQHINICSI